MDLLIFDLDGTLIDSAADLANAVNATRKWMGMAELEHDTVASYVGNGAPVLMRRALGPEASDADVERALKHFLEYYEEHKLDFTRAYDGIPELLAALKRDDVRMAVLTNKPVRISGRILEGLGLRDYFVRVYGGNSFEQKKPDPIGVQTLLHELQVDPEYTTLVGDSAVDIRTARNAGIRSIGVTWGLQPESFDADPPDMMVDRPEEIMRAVTEERTKRGVRQA
ncbi:MAG TPA: phosphoglycolate phosphatase [Bryobacteraceae bacterium]|nr:phosphoglycolate phosphatase [Bryobacteraceae bacterium]